MGIAWYPPSNFVPCDVFRPVSPHKIKWWVISWNIYPFLCPFFTFYPWVETFWIFLEILGRLKGNLLASYLFCPQVVFDFPFKYFLYKKRHKILMGHFHYSQHTQWNVRKSNPIELNPSIAFSSYLNFAIPVSPNSHQKITTTCSILEVVTNCENNWLTVFFHSAVLFRYIFSLHRHSPFGNV